MALRGAMHPRNIYKQIPNFKQLALLYPEFRKIATTDLTGKVQIDFKDEETLRILTKVLLKHDFNLTIKIPPNKLVPTVSLRLNYILWIEDLMKYASFTEMKNVKGIDIGTGAVCIYPLLLAKMYGCTVYGTEIDETSIKSAIENVKNNNLENLIKVIKVDKETILKNLRNTIEENEYFHFTMCNPPFYESNLEEGTTIVDKKIKKQPPKNAPTGSDVELAIEGGERLFIERIIEESILIGEKIKIYTTMVGKKSNSYYCNKLLRKHKIKNSTWTHFCQGNTKRWGIAWSFLPMDICDLRNAPVIRDVKYPKGHPYEIKFLMKDKYVLIDDIVADLKKIMDELQMNIKELEIQKMTEWGCEVTAQNDTWSHTRRKRRLIERQNKNCKEIKLENTNITEETNTELKVGTIECFDEKDENVQLISKTDTKISDHKEPLLVFNLFVNVLKNKEDPEKNIVNICLFFESGIGGKDALVKVRQYLVNKLNVQVYYQQLCDTSKKKQRKYKKAKKDPSSELSNAHGEEEEEEEEEEKKIDILSADDSAADSS